MNLHMLNALIGGLANSFASAMFIPFHFITSLSFSFLDDVCHKILRVHFVLVTLS